MNIINKIKKKALISYLLVLKIIYPAGTSVKFKNSKYLQNLCFWFDRSTDNRFILELYEPELIEVIASNVKPDDTFYDLGAHWGFFSLIASQIVGPAGKIYAFEPMPQNFERLVKNVENNNIAHIKALNLAVSNSSGTINFSNSTDSYANTYKNATDNFIEVRTLTLDYFVFKEGNKPPDFLKIDVEGAELDVLNGANEVIETFKPKIHLSTHDIHVPGINDLCLNFLIKKGYYIKLISKNDAGSIKDFLCIAVN